VETRDLPHIIVARLTSPLHQLVLRRIPDTDWRLIARSMGVAAWEASLSAWRGLARRFVSVRQTLTERPAASGRQLLECSSYYLNLLGHDGNMMLVGALEQPLSMTAFGLIFGRRSLSGSPIGGGETQEMLDFFGTHNSAVDVEVIPIQKVNEAHDRLVKSDVKYCFSIDMASLRSE